MKCTQFGTVSGDEGRSGRELILVEADSTEELGQWPVLSSSHFICLVVWDAPPNSDVVLRVARTLVESGAVYVCTFGEGCERVHDAVDEVIMTGEREPDDEHVIPTTWHANEPLDDALWFALFTAYPSAAYESTCRATVVVAIKADRYAASLRRDLSDPVALSARILAE